MHVSDVILVTVVAAVLWQVFRCKSSTFFISSKHWGRYPWMINQSVSQPPAWVLCFWFIQQQCTQQVETRCFINDWSAKLEPLWGESQQAFYRGCSASEHLRVQVVISQAQPLQNLAYLAQKGQVHAFTCKTESTICILLCGYCPLRSWLATKRAYRSAGVRLISV